MNLSDRRFDRRPVGFSTQRHVDPVATLVAGVVVGVRVAVVAAAAVGVAVRDPVDRVGCAVAVGLRRIASVLVLSVLNGAVQVDAAVLEWV